MLETVTISRRTKRNPERTRERLLYAAFQEIFKSGFRGTDLDTILDAAGVTKGAMYHHFENKEALGYAVVDEVIAAINHEKWVLPLRNAQNPIDALIRIIQSTSVRLEDLRRGCPLNNLAQEMSPLDEGFRKRIANVFRAFHDAVAAALRDGRKRGMVRHDVDPDEAAMFLIAAYEGYLSLAKNSQDVGGLQAGKRTLTRYLESLRATGRRPRVPRSS